MPPKIKLSKKKMRSANDYSTFSTDISKCNGKLFSQDTSSNRLELDTWTLPNNKNFMSFIKGKFNTSTVRNQRVPIKLWKESDSDFIDINPFKHQKFVSDYLSENSPYRGLLLYHGFILIHIPLFQEYAHIFIYMQNIHIPLSFYYLYKCTHYSLWYRLYLITWPITITRSTTLIYYTYSSYVYKQYLSFVLLLSLFILILYIDYLWTPWNRYILLLK